ncbi:YvrJ family protein [Ureibacillus sp. Re31]|uniref:YvrJ family protein n=1 Tax=Ureibacillus galli TaxID=2762222 RepID=A0ABR8XGA3_9BACL|nr:YvrJ family protein [Ureibacillus galli]MBD8028236.1 YvrJ family protein [Ureibacillus galli]
MVTSEWVTKVGNFGFPISITIYLFIRFERKIENLETSINYLSEVIKGNEKGLMVCIMNL